MKHLSTPRMDKCKWQNDREGLHFYKNITRSEKYPNINCTETGKGAASQLWGTGSVIRGSGSQIRGAGSEIRRDPPNLTPAWNCIDKHCSGANLNLFCSHRRTAENYIRTILCALMQSTCSGHDTRNWEKFHLVELNILIKISSKQPKSSLLLTFRPLSEAFIRRSWYYRSSSSGSWLDKLVSSQESGRTYDWVGSSLRPGLWIVDLPSGYKLPLWSIW